MKSMTLAKARKSSSCCIVSEFWFGDEFTVGQGNMFRGFWPWQSLASVWQWLALLDGWRINFFHYFYTLVWQQL